MACIALELRALYRLCGALFVCGGGARSDALGIIDDTEKRCTGALGWEIECFQLLGEEILDDLMRPWDAGLNNSKAVRFRGATDESSRDEEKQIVKEESRSKTTSLPSKECPWDTDRLDLDTIDSQRLLASSVRKCSDSCSPEVVWDGSSSSAFIQLCADRDIKAGELVLSETAAAVVTTSSPEDVYDDHHTLSRQYHCDICASLLVVPYGTRAHFQGSVSITEPESSQHVDPLAVSSSEASANAACDSNNRSPDQKPMDISQQQPKDDANPLPTPQPTSSPRPSPPLAPSSASKNLPDLQYYCPTHLRPTCSSSCRALQIPANHVLDTANTEWSLRNSHLHNPTPTQPLAVRKKQCLTDLLTLRTIATAFKTHQYPLQSTSLLFADHSPNSHPKAQEEQQWSFTTNVVRPLYHLDQFFAEHDTDAFTHLKLCDGWVLHALRQKIESAMRISTRPHCAKVFDQDGMLKSTLGEGDKGWDRLFPSGSADDSMMGDNEHEGQESEDERVWIGGINPIFNLIRIADPSKGEIPNVGFVQRGGEMYVFAMGKNGDKPDKTDTIEHEDTEITIKAGQPLLRPPYPSHDLPDLKEPIRSMFPLRHRESRNEDETNSSWRAELEEAGMVDEDAHLHSCVRTEQRTAEGLEEGESAWIDEDDAGDDEYASPMSFVRGDGEGSKSGGDDGSEDNGRERKDAMEVD